MIPSNEKEVIKALGLLSDNLTNKNPVPATRRFTWKRLAMP